MKRYTPNAIYTRRAYAGWHAFETGNDDAGPDSPVGWGATPDQAREALADMIDMLPCADCEYGPCHMNCGPAKLAEAGA